MDYEFCLLGDINNGVQYVTFSRGDGRPNDPWPEGCVIRERNIVKPAEEKYCKWVNDHLEPMTASERSERDAYDVAQAEAEESARQTAKNATLKGIENEFITLCLQLGFEDKAGFDELESVLESLSDRDQARDISLKLLSIDAAGKRYSATWWDDCVWHPELVQ